MEWWLWVILAGIAVLALVMFVAFRRRSLRDRFGPEYDRAVESAGSTWSGEHQLRDRVKRHRKLELRPLAPDEAGEYARRWFVLQSTFVDHPQESCVDANDLLEEVLRARGYPVEEDFDTQADLVSVEHPTVVPQYRIAHEAAVRGTDGPGGTESLRVAFVAYRNLFAELLGEHAEPEADEDRDVEIDLTAAEDPAEREDEEAHEAPIQGRR